jgi:hypothetical protein
MRFCEIDPRRIQYFTHACSSAEVRIPTEDSDAWTWTLVIAECTTGSPFIRWLETEKKFSGTV